MASNLIEEFKVFLSEGGAAELSVGVVIGVVIGHTIESLIENIVLPLVSFGFGGIPIEDYFLVLRDGVRPGPYNSLDDATAAGALVLKYGAVATNLISLLFVIVAIFLSLRVLNRLRNRRFKRLFRLRKQDDA